MTEDEICSLLSDLASIDTHEINLRDHPDAYAAVETALAPLLQDLAAHEASNRIKTENLETLRGVIRELVECKRMKERIKLQDALIVETEDDLAEMEKLRAEYAERQPKAWDAARAGLGESNGNG